MSEKTGQKNFFEPIIRYFKEVKGELKKVVYPTMKNVRKNTTVVIVVVIIFGLLISALDFVFHIGRNALITNDSAISQIDQAPTSEIPIDEMPIDEMPEIYEDGIQDDSESNAPSESPVGGE